MDDDIKNIFSDLGLIMQVGLVVVICLAIGLILGLLADRWIAESFVFKIIGIVLGLTAGILQAYRILNEKLE